MSVRNIGNPGPEQVVPSAVFPGWSCCCWWHPAPPPDFPVEQVADTLEKHARAMEAAARAMRGLGGQTGSPGGAPGQRNP